MSDDESHFVQSSKALSRGAAANNIVKLGLAETNYQGYSFLAKLLGYEDVLAFVHQLTNEHIAVLEKIAGPHGAIIIKILERQREET